MAWKKSEDGGLDYDVTLDIRRKKNKDKLIESNSFTATTVTFFENVEDVKFDEHNIYNRKTLLG